MTNIKRSKVYRAVGVMSGGMSVQGTCMNLGGLGVWVGDLMLAYKGKPKLTTGYQEVGDVHSSVDSRYNTTLQ